jgi:hypothetical protein
MRKEFLGYSTGKISLMGLWQELDPKGNVELRLILSIILYIPRISLKFPLGQENGF